MHFRERNQGVIDAFYIIVIKQYTGIGGHITRLICTHSGFRYPLICDFLCALLSRFEYLIVSK